MGAHKGRTIAGVALCTTLAVTIMGAAPAAADDDDVLVGVEWGDDEADAVSLDWQGDNDAKKDPGSLLTITKAIGARDVWREKDAAGRAVTGSGVTVAVVDSGVSAVPGLHQPGKLVQGPDLSLEANVAGVDDTDSYGHGTHMAGIIAARDDAVRENGWGRPRSKGHDQLGIAPDAQLLALKLATTDGTTDVSQVIAALDWVAQHRTDNGMNVRVVNLSFGTTALQDYQVDPLVAAAENAWRSGLVVVVSGGNDGAAGLTNPAIDPYVLSVGSSDPLGKVGGWDKPAVAEYSAVGTPQRHVDLLAPGRSVASLRDPGSFVDVNHPEGRVSGDDTARLFRGSGTSQAAAVVSGAAALLLQAYPGLTPDQVKAALVSTAKPLKNADPLAAGAGQVDVEKAYEAVEDAYRAAASPRFRPGPAAVAVLTAQQQHPVAQGTGSIEAARGGTNLVDVQNGAVLTGEVDVQGQPWDAAGWSKASAQGTSWSGGQWNRARWSGEGWTSNGWARARWSGTSWSRARWSDAGWERARWSRARWSDAGWERARWSDAGWN